MTRHRVDDTIRRAIGGDIAAVEWIVAQADATEDALVMVMTALLELDPAGLQRARTMAATSRDRQVVEIAQAQLDGRIDQVDALARDHLVDHPDNLLVAWIASGAVVPTHRDDGC